ncbi:MAG: hypothetical protein KDJ14_00320 [Xanthomonadales bacterium]|nr:hypothetical protein [Xanthomonadales bacterium]
MKTLLRMACVASLILLAAGCASSGSSYAATKVSPFSVDQTYMGQVEAIARRRGVDVHWVNPPRVGQDEVAKR